MSWMKRRTLFGTGKSPSTQAWPCNSYKRAGARPTRSVSVGGAPTSGDPALLSGPGSHDMARKRVLVQIPVGCASCSRASIAVVLVFAQARRRPRAANQRQRRRFLRQIPHVLQHQRSATTGLTGTDPDRMPGVGHLDAGVSTGADSRTFDALDPADSNLAPKPGKHTRPARSLLHHRSTLPLERLIPR